MKEHGAREKKEKHPYSGKKMFDSLNVCDADELFPFYLSFSHMVLYKTKVVFFRKALIKIVRISVICIL